MLSRIRIWSYLVTGLVAVGLLSGCLPFLRATKDPLPVEVLASPVDARCSVVLLPGVWDRPNDFRRQGFAEELTSRDLNVRLVAADAHVGYYKKRSILKELRHLVAAERQAGRKVWIAGNSLGGVGGLIYARHSGGDIEGVLLMAPYLGEPETIDEIRAAGGVLAWAPPGTEPLEGDPEEAADGKLDRSEYARETWRWLAGWHRDMERREGVGRPPIWLGWGVDDDFSVPAGLAAELLPDGHAMPAPGGHDWNAWKQNWRDFLDTGALDGCR